MKLGDIDKSESVLAGDMAPREGAERGVTARVVVLSLLLAALFGWMIPVVDYKFSNTFLGATHLSPGAMGTLLLLLALRPLVARVKRNWTFNRNESLVVYLGCLFSCLVPGIGGNNYFVSFIIGPFYFATRENGWLEALSRLPHWMSPALNGGAVGTDAYDRALVEKWYIGLRAGETIPWSAWIVPLLAWASLMIAAFAMLACLSVILRAQWSDREALDFPLLQLPLEMTSDLEAGRNRASKTSFWRTPAMWCGFLIPVVWQGLNGLNLYFPDVPLMPQQINSGALFTEAPWNQLGNVPIRVWPIAIGVTYLLTSEISFSLWFFFLFFKLQFIIAYYIGMPSATLPEAASSGGKIFMVFQEAGAHLAYVGFLVWIGREHFGHVLRRALHPRSEKAKPDEAREALSYPVAFWGFWVGLGWMWAWSCLAGVNPIVALYLWLSYLVLAIIITRVVAAGGLLFVHHSWMPLGVWSQVFGSGPGTLLAPTTGSVPAALLEMSMIQDYRASLMPSFIHSVKMAHDRRINARHLMALIAAIIAVSLLIGLQMNVRLGYENGGLQLQGWLREWGPRQAGRNMLALSREASDSGLLNLVWVLNGALIVSVLVLLRARFLWFTLHPLGVLMAQTYPMQTLWVSVFIGWSCKALVMRFGGFDAYQKLRPTFLGIVLGDVSMMLFWLLIDGWQGRTAHQLMPG